MRETPFIHPVAWMSRWYKPRHKNDEGRTTTLLYKIYTSFLFLWKGSNVCSVRETGRDKETKTDCYIDPQLLLTIWCCVIFKGPLSTSSVYWPGEYSTGGHCELPPQAVRTRWLQAGTDSRLTLIPTDPDPPVGIHIHHFIMPTSSDQPRDCFHLFIQVLPVQRNLWLTARSRVNMQTFRKRKDMDHHHITLFPSNMNNLQTDLFYP